MSSQLSTYTVLAAAVEAITEEKNSEFLAFLHPIRSRDEAMEWVQDYRQRYPDATHVCWAYIIGNTRSPKTQAFNDDGEPSGTAGKPMLHVLTERDLGDSLAVVVRYFGGVKLGAGGLVRAYSAAVSEAVNSAQLITVYPRVELIVRVDFSKEAKIRHLINHYQGQLLSVDYAARVSLQLSLSAAEVEAFIRQASDDTAGDIHIERISDVFNNS